MASNWATARAFAPCIAHIDIKSSMLPIFVEWRTEYARLRSMRDEVGEFYAGLDGIQNEYFDFDGTLDS